MYLTIMASCLGVALLLLILILTISLQKSQYIEKLSPFECGFLSYEESRSPFSVHFFLVGLIFLVFDIELILIFPYLVMSCRVSFFQIIAITVFVGMLRGGLVLE